jgi:hypothetical protein
LPKSRVFGLGLPGLEPLVKSGILQWMVANVPTQQKWEKTKRKKNPGKSLKKN